MRKTYTFARYNFLYLALFANIIQASWSSSPTTIDTGNASSAPSLVVDNQGNVTAAWLENYDNIGDDPQAASFLISSNTWLPAQSIVLTGAGFNAPQVIVDSFGTVTLVWTEFYNENQNTLTLFASRSLQGSTWTTPVPLSSVTISTNIQQPVSMVVDAQSNVTIAWLEQDLQNSHYAIGAARFSSNISDAPTLYSFLDGDVPNANSNIKPTLVVDQLGYVTAIWQENTDSGCSVQASRLDPAGSAWSTAVILDGSSPNANSVIAPQVVVDSVGVVTVVWQEQVVSEFAVQASRFVPGLDGTDGAWTSYLNLVPALSNAYQSLAPVIIVDSTNSVTVAAVDAGLSLWTSSFVADGLSWTYPETALNSGTIFSLTPISIGVDAAGIVTVGWVNNESSHLFVQAARGFSTSWDAAVTIGQGSFNENRPLLLVVDLLGNITMSWMESFSVLAARFQVRDNLWSQAVTLNTGNIDNQINPVIVVSSLGSVTIAWQETVSNTPSYAIQAASFTLDQNAWTAAVTLDNGTQTPNAYYSSMTQQINMVVDPFENVTVAWMETDSDVEVIQAARFTAKTSPVVIRMYDRMWLKNKAIELPL